MNSQPTTSKVGFAKLAQWACASCLPATGLRGANGSVGVCPAEAHVLDCCLFGSAHPTAQLFKNTVLSPKNDPPKSPAAMAAADSAPRQPPITVVATAAAPRCLNLCQIWDADAWTTVILQCTEKSMFCKWAPNSEEHAHAPQRQRKKRSHHTFSHGGRNKRLGPCRDSAGRR